MFTRTSPVRFPRSAVAGYQPTAVAKAYNYPVARYTGQGAVVGVIELGGGLSLSAYPNIDITVVPVGSGSNTLDGPNGADGEVQLDVDIIAAIAPHAKQRVYFAGNTDADFIAAINRAVTDGCNLISISWGGPENQWEAASVKQMEAAFLNARRQGVVVCVAAGDSGADDGTNAPVTDYPASSPNVISCGGTSLYVDSTGARTREFTWDDNDTSSATGGGVSKIFPGVQVPLVAGNADPNTGYIVTIDGKQYVIGGTSAVAPLYTGLFALITEAIGQPIGKKVDVINTFLTNLGMFFDVTAGDNGAYRAGVGRDDVTGLGVLDGGKLLAVLQDSVSDPSPVPAPTSGITEYVIKMGSSDYAAMQLWLQTPHNYHRATQASEAFTRSTVTVQNE